MGTNPAVSLPRADHARAALRKLDLLVVSEIVKSTDTASAGPHVLLPAASNGRGKPGRCVEARPQRGWLRPCEHGAWECRASGQNNRRTSPGPDLRPIHWNDETAARARVGALVHPITDPHSGQPDSKAVPATLAPVFTPRTVLFFRARRLPATPSLHGTPSRAAMRRALRPTSLSQACSRPSRQIARRRTGNPQRFGTRNFSRGADPR
jgi:hypothetical protein